MTFVQKNDSEAVSRSRRMRASGNRRREHRRRRSFEALEDRVLLSVGDPVREAALARLEGAELVDDGEILWSGVETDFVVDEWIARIDMTSR